MLVGQSDGLGDMAEGHAFGHQIDGMGSGDQASG